MKIYNINEMKKGWFIGNFAPSVVSTDLFEVGIKKYNPGDYEPTHYHNIVTEITVILEGVVRMNDKILKSGTIILIEPKFSTNFFAITSASTLVVKFPSIPNDKYIS